MKNLGSRIPRAIAVNSTASAQNARAVACFRHETVSLSGNEERMHWRKSYPPSQYNAYLAGLGIRLFGGAGDAHVFIVAWTRLDWDE
jgi:hypothetical protein